jgi:LacI family transcriptional regulator
MPTIADVARRAGVTTATVSNVLTGRVVVRPETRDRVQKAIAELDYRPNLIARGLAQGKTRTLALVVPAISNPSFAEVVEEVERVADLHDYQLLLCITHHSTEQGERHLSLLARRWVDGFIVVGMAASTEDVLALARRGNPVVLGAWNSDVEAGSLPGVDIDFHLAGRLATEHLLERGHRRIAAVVEAELQQTRLDGYRQALDQAGLVPSPEYIQPGDSSFESGYRAAERLLALPEPPTAIFAGSDWMALGAIEAITGLGQKVPGDISIVGVDDIALSAYAHPPLTTISVPKKEMARAATKLLLECLASPEETPSPHKIRIDPHLVLRQSTASSSTNRP